MCPWLCAVFSFLFHLELTSGINITLVSSDNCRDVTIDAYNPLFIYYNGLELHPGRCEFGIYGGGAGKHLCIATIPYSMGNCKRYEYPKSTFRLTYGAGVYNDVQHQRFECDDLSYYSGRDWCTSHGEVSISIRGLHVGITRLKLKVYIIDDTVTYRATTACCGETERLADKGVSPVLIIVISSAVLVIITMLVLFCYCWRRLQNTGVMFYWNPVTRQAVPFYPPPAPTCSAGQGTTQPTGSVDMAQSQAVGYTTQPQQQGYQAPGHQPSPTGYRHLEQGYQTGPALPPAPVNKTAGLQTTEDETLKLVAPPQRSHQDDPPQYPGY